MADLTITQCDQAQVFKQFTGPAVEAIAEGQRCRFDPTTGQIALGNATNAAEAVQGGIATHAAGVGEALTIINEGIVDLGAALDALAFGASVFVSDTDGTFGTTAGTVSVVAGIVVPGWDSIPAQKLLHLTGQ